MNTIFITACGFLLDHHVSLTSQAMLYVLAVVLAAYTLDWLSSVVFAITAVTRDTNGRGVCVDNQKTLSL